MKPEDLRPVDEHSSEGNARESLWRRKGAVLKLLLRTYLSVGVGLEDRQPAGLQTLAHT